MSKIKLLLSVLLLATFMNVNAQDRTVTGVVRNDASKTGVPNVTVTQKGTKRAVVTSEDGSFSIKVSGANPSLVISSVGYNAKEVDASGNGPIVVDLVNAKGDLNEVVVTALGITRQKKTLVYATQTVKPAELTEVRDPNNVLNSLAGKVANATIAQGSGGPGSGARIVLRGNRSIQGSNNALIVVDGVPLSNTTASTAGSDFGFVQSSDGASNINPDDIESMTVLRGASAAALYGNQAGNGVIVITTKKGRKDRVQVNVNSGVTMEQAWAIPFFQNQYGQGNGGQIKANGDSWGAKMTGQDYTNFLGNSSKYSPQENNVKDFFRTGTSFNNSISVSGGGDKMQTYLSYTNNNINGIIDRNSLNRNTVNLRITNQIGSRFSTDAKVTYINQQTKNRPRAGEENAPVIDIYNMARSISTADAKQYEVINNLGLPFPTDFPATLSSIYQNPYWMVNRTSINEDRDRVIGFITAKYKITDWLTLSGKANLDKTFDRGENAVHAYTTLWAKGGGDYSKNNIVVTEKWFDAQLEGNNNITKDLRVNYRVGGIFQDSKYDATSLGANGLNVTNKFSMNFATAPSVSSSFTEVQTQSVFAQANFSWKDLIFLDASIRNDWDSRLPKPYTYQYPSIGASAILSDLFNLAEPISFLKASINYAEVGNGGQFGLLRSVYNYGQGAGNGFLQRSSVLPLPGLKPEIVKNLELGLEARFLKNRFGFSFTWYKSNSFNQLLKVGLPVATGYSDKYINAGNIQNQGIELLLDGYAIQSKDFKWNIAFNASFNKNKVIALDPNIKTFYLSGGFGRSGTPVVSEGGSYGDLLAFKWATNDKGGHVVDKDGKPVLTSAQELIGNFNPKATIGLTNTFDIGPFYARLLIDGRVGGTVVSGTEMNLAFSGIPEITAQHREGGWALGGTLADGTPVSATTTAQDFWQIASGKRYGAGEFFAYDATNFRVRELSIGYNLPVKNTKVIKNARLSLIGRNLLWLYRGKSKLDIPGLGKRKMWFDPDMSLGNGNFQGVEYGTMPATRSLGVNLQLTF